mgnify:CR=1 FL=1
MTSVDLEYIRYDTTGAYAPAGDVVTQGANSLANYPIAGATLTGPIVQEDGKTVVLTVDGKIDGGDSSLVIKGVADLAGNSIAETTVVIPASGPKITPLGSADFELVAASGDIYDGETLLNGWVNTGGVLEFEKHDEYVSLNITAKNGWLQHDNNESVWETGVADGGSWTAEVRVRLANDEGNAIVIWGANGAERNILQINTGNTQTLSGTVLDESDNTDAFHSFRMAYEAGSGSYYFWRDGQLLNVEGAPRQAGTGASRFIVGDCCSNIPMSAVDLEYIRYDTTGAFAPAGDVVTQGANSLANYSIAGATVTGITVLEDGKTVVLTVDGAVDGGNSSLSIKNVADLAGNSIAETSVVIPAGGPKITPLGSADFELAAAPADIYDGEALANGWVNAGGETNFELNDGYVSMISAANNGWLQHDNDESVWEKGVADGGSWTAEISVRLAADDGNGLVIWGANGAERNILQVNTGNTQTLTGTVLDENDNTDTFHTFRLAFEAEAGLYYVWRDGKLLTPDGIAKQAGTGANRFIVGDCCTGIPMTTVDLKYIRYDTTGAFSPGKPSPEAPTLSIVNNSDGTVTVTFEGRLQAAPTANGPWADVEGATSPQIVPANQAMQFSRAVR